MDILSHQRTDFKEIFYEKDNWVARITINRPHNYNAYSTNCLEELALAFRQAAFDDEVAVIVFTGAGDRAFCTGGDVKEYQERYARSPHAYWKYMRLFGTYIESILKAGKPVIARINGMAAGGATQWLPIVVGDRRARYMLMTNRRIPAY
jgi:enoyl-CoA hydratase/carnithine racemase